MFTIRFWAVIVGLCALVLDGVAGTALYLDLRPGDGRAEVKPQLGYVATPQRTQLYRSGAKGDSVLYRVVDMPGENLRCVMLTGTGTFGRAVSCQPLDTLEGR